MGERQILAGPEEMATTSTAVATVPPQIQEDSLERVAVITLRQPRTQTRKKVVWTEDTVDNEHMNKKKSKCCCIYEKPKKFGESDSEDSDEDECTHCFGHVEKKRGKHHHHEASPDCAMHAPQPTQTQVEPAPAPEQTATLTLQPPAPPDIPLAPDTPAADPTPDKPTQ